MRLRSIAGLVTLSGVLTLLACKDTTASGSPSIGEESLSTPSSPVFTKLPAGCRKVHGDAELTLVSAPNDPFGRTVGTTKGPLKGAETSTITNITPGAGGVLNVTSLDVWVVGPTDLIIANGVATYTPIPGAPIGDVSVAGTETVVGGTGQYAGATGTLAIDGVGHTVFGPSSGPGIGWFDLNYDGTVCT